MIRAYDRQTFNRGLGNQQTVKGVMVMRRQESHLECVGMSMTSAFYSMPGQTLWDILRGRQRESQLAQRSF